MFFGWLRYVFLMLILLVPVVAVDDVIGNIESTGTRYTLRLLMLVFAFLVIRLIPKPVKQ
ncbi:MAG: hypothetical protein Q7S02_06735 [bacterium]|nr:hypothetical protein [bacterium]